MKKIGVIDIGSNSIKLDIYLVRDNGVIVKKNKHRSLMSLEDNCRNGDMSEYYIQSTLKVVQTYVDLCTLTGIDDIVVFATESIRRARNKRDIIRGIDDLCHININIMSGKEEAFYSYEGIKDDVDVTSGIMIDIGGGSTEVLFFDNEKVMESISFPFGARTISNKFQLKDCITEIVEKKIMEYLVYNFSHEISWLNGKNDLVLVGSGGTMKNVAKLINSNINPCLGKNDNYYLTDEYVKIIYKVIKNKKIEDIKKLKGMSDRRVEVIKGGIEILLSFLMTTDINSIIVSKKGIREGVLKDYLEKNPYNK
ncbi:hypothetical protein SH2C18_34520 [Clostridium sediminicola]|uniref:Ppx/GppA phosphatase family protein n=1 Tax=Clostridium sediminicola TaxID=3114879 RepID=UPI0031F20455